MSSWTTLKGNSGYAISYTTPFGYGLWTTDRYTWNGSLLECFSHNEIPGNIIQGGFYACITLRWRSPASFSYIQGCTLFRTCFINSSLPFILIIFNYWQNAQALLWTEEKNIVKYFFIKYLSITCLFFITSKNTRALHWVMAG